MFEQNNETTSPPSRGRSPVASVTSDSSRPYSKVRTSFISVDRRGQSGSTPGKMSHSNSTGADDGMSEPRKAPESSDAGAPTMNGDAAGPSSSEDVSSRLDTANGIDNPGKEKDEGANGLKKGNYPVDVQAANPDKPVTGAEEDPADMLPADPKEETAVTGGAALKSDDSDLGSVLKGSPFASTTTEQSVKAPESAKDRTQIAVSSPSEAPKTPVAAKVNGQPKEPGSDIESPSNARAAKTKGPTPRPSAINNNKASTSTSGNLAVKSLKAPQTDGPSDSKRPSARTSLERRSLQSKPPSNRTEKAKKAPAQAANSIAPKAEPTKARQSSIKSGAGLGNKSGPTSPLHKPRPKSPTRPVRIPASATAPTASSAAKLGGAPPSRSPSRASITSSHKPPNLNKTRPTHLTSATAQSRQKSARSSLPPQSGAAQKPKPRTSTASAKGTDDSFLARMMRPTESSKSKTHEKLEVKSPPRKSVVPKRQIGETEESEKEQVKEATNTFNGEAAKAQPQEETPTPLGESNNEKFSEENVQASADNTSPTSVEAVH